MTPRGKRVACIFFNYEIQPCTSNFNKVVNLALDTTFTLYNSTIETATFTVGCAVTGSVSSCSAPNPPGHQVSVPAKSGSVSGSATFHITYTTGSTPGPGTLTALVTGDGDLDATMNITVRSISTGPKGADSVVGPGTGRIATFTVTNLDTQAATTLDVASACGPLVPVLGCQTVPSPAQITLQPAGQPGASQQVTVTHNAPPLAGDTGRVWLRVSAGGNQLDSGWIKVGTAGATVSKGGSTIVAPNQAGQFVPFTVTSAAPYSTAFELEQSCIWSGGTNPNCSVASSTGTIAPAGVATPAVNFSSIGTGDTIQVVLRARKNAVLLDTGYTTVYVAGATISPHTGTVLQPPSTALLTQAFTVTNLTKGGTPTVTFHPTCTNATSGSCSVNPTSFQFSAVNQPTTATVTYTTTTGDSGTVRLITRYNGVDLDSGKVKVNIAKAAVIPTGGSDGMGVAAAPSTQYTQSFTLTNTGLGTTSYNLSGSCAAVAAGSSCNVSTVLLSNIAPLGTGTTTLTYTTTGTPGTGTAAAIASFQTIYMDSGWVNVTSTGGGGGGVLVTPKGTAITRALNTTSVDSFTVKNTGASPATFGLSSSCTGQTFALCLVNPTSTPSLAAGASSIATVTYRATTAGAGGVVKLTATAGAATDFGTYSLTVASPVVTTGQPGPYNQAIQVGRCAASCFTARAALATVPYVSLSQERSIAITYDGDQFAGRPVVTIDVTLAAGAPLPVRYEVLAQDSIGGVITFVNGETTLRSAPPPSTTFPTRLGFQFDAIARGWTTAVHNMSAIVRADFGAGYVEQDTLVVKVLFVNERKSPVAKGWTIAGLQRVYPQGTSGDEALLTEGDGSVIFFSGCTLPSCFSPGGEFSKLSKIAGLYVREWPDSSRVEFDALGRMSRFIARSRADTTLFTYDAQGRLDRVYDPFRKTAGNVHLYTQLAYGANGLSSITEPGAGQLQSGGRATNLVVAADSTLTSWSDPDSVLTRFVYDASKRLERLINRRGDTSFFAYHAVTWKLTSTSAPSFAVDPNAYGAGQTRRLTTTLVPWQTIAVPTAATNLTPFPSIRADTVRAVVTAPGGVRTVFTADRWGQPLRSVVKSASPDSFVTVITRDVNGLPYTVTGPTGSVDTTSYNASGLLAYQRAFRDSAITITYQTAFAQPLSVFGNGYPTMNYFMSGRGRIDSVRVGGTTQMRYYYDARLRIDSLIDNLGHKDTLLYEAIFGNVATLKQPGKHTTQMVYDGFGRDSTTTTAPLPTQSAFYDILNRPTKTANAAGVGAPSDTLRYAYDSLFLTSVTAQNGAITQTHGLSRNALGAVIAASDPSGLADSSFFDDRGLVRRWKNRRGDTVVTRYDSLQRPVSVKLYRLTTLVRADSFSYNFAQRITVGRNNHSIDSLFTDSTGWTDSVVTRFFTDLTKRTVLKYKKGSFGQLDSVYVVPPSPIAATTRGYGWNTANGTLTAVKINSGTITLSYNGDLLATQRTQPGSVTQFFDRTSSHESYTWNYTPTAVNQALLRQANFDSLGRTTIATRAAGQVLDRWVTGYQYDARGRLTFVGDTLYHYAAGTCTGPPIVDPDYGIKPCVGTGMTKTLQYVDTVGYDVVGNIVKNTGHGGTGTPTYDAANRLTTWPGLSSVTSDADGNLTSRTVSGGGATTTYFWSPDALLDSVKTSTGGFIRYDYNAFGLLVRKWITPSTPDRHFVWDQGHLAIELNGTLTQRVGEYAYLPGTDQPLALITGATAVNLVRVIYQDVQGSVVGLVNSNGTVNRYQTNSDPWGISGPWNVALPDTMRLRWQGLFFDGGISGLYYARARWYSPNIKRFLSPDPLGVAAGVNYYTFAGNDPMNGGDPSGLGPCTEEQRKNGYQDVTYSDEAGTPHTSCNQAVSTLVYDWSSLFGRLWLHIRATTQQSLREEWESTKDFLLTGSISCGPGVVCGVIPPGWFSPRGGFSTEAARLTSKQARDLARWLGYSRELKGVPTNLRNQKAFTNGANIISQDIDMHLGTQATWKLFDMSGARLGTYDAWLLRRLGK